MKLCPRDLQIELAVIRYWRRLKGRELYGRRKHCSSCWDEPAWVLWGSERLLLLPRYPWRTKYDAQRQSMCICQGRMPSPHLGAFRHSKNRVSSWKPHGSSFSVTAAAATGFQERKTGFSVPRPCGFQRQHCKIATYHKKDRKRFVKEGNCKISILFKINLLPCTVTYLFRDYFHSHRFPLFLH